MEYTYVIHTINQAVEDRYKLLNFYIGLSTTVATLSVGLISFAKDDLNATIWLLIGMLLVVIAMIGWLFLAMMVRLRRAWRESIIVMNHIKEFYLVHNPDLRPAFLWTTQTAKRITERGNIHFYSSFLIILLNSLSLAAGSGFGLNLVVTSIPAILLSTVILLISIFVQLVLYNFALRMHSL